MKGLAAIVGSDALSALIVGVVLALVALVLALVGSNLMSLSRLAPTRTGRQLRQDAHAVSERIEA